MMKQTLSSLTLAGICLTGLTGLANAQNLLTNPGFETNDITGWLGNTSSDVLEIGVDTIFPGVNLVTGTEGSYVGKTWQQFWWQGFPEAPLTTYFYQEFTDGIAEGVSMSFTADTYVSSEDPYLSSPSSASMWVKYFDNTSDMNYIDGIFVDVSSQTEDIWISNAIDFSIPAGAGVLQVGFENYQVNWGGGALYIDNTGLAVVPEPATFAALAGFLALGLVLFRRYRRN